MEIEEGGGPDSLIPTRVCACVQAGGATAFCTLLKTRYEGKDGVEGRREREQLAVLFSLLDPAHQPVGLIDDLIASLPGASGTSRIFTIQQVSKA